MSPRPRTVQDTAILDAAIEVLSRIGPEKMTLADVGSAVGLSAATLVQRFGSKRDLLLALVRHMTGEIDNRFEAAMANNESPLDAIFAAATDRAGKVATHVSLGNRLSFYMSQLEDPEFHVVAIENTRRAIDGFQRMLDAAVEAGELTEGYTDTAQLAETIYSMQMGSLLVWAVMNEGSFKAKVRRDMDILLRPFRRGPRKAGSSGADRGGARDTEALAAGREAVGV
jgi:AcrR family transcriptional regulator